MPQSARPKFPVEPLPMNPYLGGALAGLLLIVSVVFIDKYFGASTTFVRATAMLEQLFSPGHVAENLYFKKEAPVFDWQWLFVVGVFLGSLLSSRLEGSFRLTMTPPTWTERFGNTPGLRAVVAFFGGVLAIMGARLAGGCPSGHGLSGTVQLAVSGFVALVCFFLGGLVTARLLYRGK
ncbi:YeeE/YedE thiosulfate transporter family protein [Megalodesulfovibrio paquesii]